MVIFQYSLVLKDSRWKSHCTRVSCSSAPGLEPSLHLHLPRSLHSWCVCAMQTNVLLPLGCRETHKWDWDTSWTTVTRRAWPWRSGDRQKALPPGEYPRLSLVFQALLNLYSSQEGNSNGSSHLHSPKGRFMGEKHKNHQKHQNPILPHRRQQQAYKAKTWGCAPSWKHP